MPWWAALLIAVAASAIGYVIDSGHKELTHVFAGLYVAGCVAAVLAVRQSGVFTAVIQPPLILFCAVPGAYWLFHDGKVGRLKDLLINCGYPLIERFPLMLGTAGGVLLIGLARWYFGMSQQGNRESVKTKNTGTDSGEDADSSVGSGPASSLVSGIGDKLNSLLGLKVRDKADADDAEAATTESKRKPARGARGSRTSPARSNRSRSRQGRPPLDDEDEPPMGRPRRRRPPPPRDYEPDPSRRSRRRPRPPVDPDAREASPREPRREPRSRRSPHERPAPRGSRFDPYDRYEPTPEPFDSYEKPYDAYESYDAYERPRRRGAPNGSNGPTHHPVSRGRYRGAPPEDEPRPERRTRSRAAGRSPAESWEYDV